MKYLHVLGLSALSLMMLAACEQKTESSVSSVPVNTPSASATTTAATPSAQVLTAANGKISIQTTGQFTDQLPQASQLISDIPSEQLLLLQNDSAADVLVYVADLGTAKSDANTYLIQLSDAIKADAKLQQVSVAAPQNNQLAYQFSETVADNTINQACQAVHKTNIYSVCAVSASQTPEQLAAIVQNISVQ